MRLKQLAVPALPDLTFITIVLFVSLGLHSRLLNSDGDLLRHLRVGETILKRGGLFHVDLFAFTTGGRRFVPYEWLSEVFVAAAFRLGGFPLVVAANAIVIALAIGLVVWFLRRREVEPMLAYAAGLIAAILGASHWLARPHLFTMLGAAALLHLLEPRARRSVWWYLPLFAVWANLHGGFLYGLVAIAIYAAGDLVEVLRTRGAVERQRWTARLRYHAGALGVALLASCVNPTGPGLLAHVTGYLGNTYMVAHTVEYHSPDFHQAVGRALLAVLVPLLVVLAHRSARLSYPVMFTLVANVAFSLHSQRNIALFGLIAIPLLALELDSAWRALPGRRLASVRATFAAGDQGSITGPWGAAIAAALIILAISGGRISDRQLLPAAVDRGEFPVEAVERARASHLSGRIYNEFHWGGYILFAWPEQKVFIDGQTDFYGEALLRSYAAVRELAPGWRELLDEWRIEIVMVPSGSSLAHELARDPAWALWHCDPTAAVLQRAGDARSIDASVQVRKLEQCTTSSTRRASWDSTQSVLGVSLACL